MAQRKCIISTEKKLQNLSKQELLSCDAVNPGCNGGYINNSLDYITRHGLSEDTCFPYEALDDDKVSCKKMCKDPKKETIESFCIVFGEDDIKRDILKSGPVITAAYVHTDFLTYKSGVYFIGEEVPKFSGLISLKIIGWGVENGQGDEINKGNKYWIVENFWGEDWGENGYARISMNQELQFDKYAYSLKFANPEVVKKTEAKKQADSASKKAKNSTDKKTSADETIDLD